MKKRLLFVVVGTLLLLSVIALIAMRFAGQKKTQAQTTPKLQAVTTLPPEPVKLEIFEQEVFVQSPTASEEAIAINGQEIEAGTKIRTGKNGRAQVLFPNHTATRLDKNSQITLKEYQASPQQVTIQLDLGRIWSRISKLIGKESYQTQTDTLIATVRGTSYGMGIVGPGLSKITTLEGDVRIKADDSCANGDEADVTANQKATVNCKDTRKPVVTELKEIEVKNDEWVQFNQKEDKALEERFGTQYFAHNDDGKTSDVLGASTIAVSPTPVATSVPQIDCTGPDGKVFKTSKADCDAFNKAWATPTPTLTPRPGPTSTPTPGPTSTSTPTPTTTPPRAQGGDPTPFVTNTPVPTATPTPTTRPNSAPSIISVTVIDISSNITTVAVVGNNLNAAHSAIAGVTIVNQEFPGITFSGTISRIDNFSGQSTLIASFNDIFLCSTYKLVLKLPNGQEIRSNTFTASFGSICAGL